MDSRGALAERNNPDGLVSVAGREIVATRFPLCDFGADAAGAPSLRRSDRPKEQHLRDAASLLRKQRCCKLRVASGARQLARGRFSIDSGTAPAAAVRLARRPP